MHFHILVINFKYSHFDPANSLWTYKGVIYERMYMFPTSGIIQKFRLIKHAYIEPRYADPMFNIMGQNEWDTIIMS